MSKSLDKMTVKELKELLNSNEEKITALTEENEGLIKENEELNNNLKEKTDSYLRNVAEFDNYKKRNAKIYSEAYNDGKGDMLTKFLAIGDGIDRAISTITDENTLAGLNLLLKSFTDILVEAGIEEINPINEKYDPLIAEAVFQCEDESLEEDVVKSVFQKGYKLDGKVIRYAKVSVVKK